MKNRKRLDNDAPQSRLVGAYLSIVVSIVVGGLTSSPQSPSQPTHTDHAFPPASFSPPKLFSCARNAEWSCTISGSLPGLLGRARLGVGESRRDLNSVMYFARAGEWVLWGRVMWLLVVHSLYNQPVLSFNVLRYAIVGTIW